MTFNFLFDALSSFFLFFFLHISNFDVILTSSSAAFSFMFFSCFCFLCLSVKMRNAFQFSSVDRASSSVIFTTCHTSSFPLPDLTTHYIYIGVCRDIPAKTCYHFLIGVCEIKKMCSGLVVNI